MGQQSDARLSLAIETAFDDCSVALFDKATGDLHANKNETLGTGHAERLPGLVAELLASADLSMTSIASIAVSVGPGSFTGIRVGVSAARGYALALGINAVGVTTLAAMAEAVRAHRPVIALHDAKRGEVYGLAMRADGTLKREPFALPVSELVGFAQDCFDETFDVVGSGAALLRAAASHSPQPADMNIASDRSVIDMAAFCRLAAKIAPGPSPVPLYLRSADAKPPARNFSLFARADEGCSTVRT